MIVPAPRALRLLGFGVIVALLPVLVSPDLWTLWLSFVAVVIGLTLADGILSLSPRRLDARLTVPTVLYVGDEDEATLELTALRPRYRAVVDVLLTTSDVLRKLPLTPVQLDANGRVEAALPLWPLRRGEARISAVWLRWTGPLGLTRSRRVVEQDVVVPVVPNIRAVRAAALKFFSQRDFASGLKAEHYVGDGSDFDSLREFLPGHDHRAIDWKASARHFKLLVREFRAERNHQVYLAFDTGHLMSETLDGIPKLDHAINAGLLMAYVCLKSGDHVGLFGFGDQVDMFTRPQRGVQSIHRLHVQTAELKYGAGETNFTIGLTDLLTRLRRRSLVVVFTDFVDTVTAELMLENLQRVARRHLVVFVTYRDADVDEIATARPSTMSHLYSAVVAGNFQRSREVVMRRLQSLGIRRVEAPVGQVSTELINQYLEIARRELI
jgi:uncharacterized protein (DUF58 family)